MNIRVTGFIDETTEAKVAIQSTEFGCGLITAVEFGDITLQSSACNPDDMAAFFLRIAGDIMEAEQNRRRTP